MPTFSMTSDLPPVTPSSFSACNSTGSPCVSHPPLNTIFFPCNVLNLYHRSLITRPLRCPACGTPFIVGGPSINIIFSGLSDSKINLSTSINLMYSFISDSIAFASNFDESFILDFDMGVALYN